MKNIVQIVDGYLAHDGIGNAALARARALIDVGCAVTVVCHVHDATAITPPAAQILTVPPGSNYHHSVMPAAVREAVIHADVVILDVGGYSPLFTLAEIATGRVIVDYHGSTPPGLIRDPGYTMNWYKGVQVLRNLIRHFDLLVTHSRFIQAEWDAHVGSAPFAREVVPLFGAVPPATSVTLAPLTGRALKLLGVGRMFPNKNWDLAIRATARLKARSRAAQFEHIGGGEDFVSQTYRTQMHGLIDTLGVRDQVTLRGSQPQAVLETALANCDAVLLPSLHEGFSLPAVEALARGKPVFASELGALPETLGGAGLLVNPFDAEALATQITAFFERPAAERQAHAEKGLARAAELSRAAFGKRFVDLILHPPAAATAALAPTPRRLPEATLEVELAVDFATRLPYLEGVARVTGLTEPLSATARLTTHLVDAAGRILQYDERPVQSRSGAPTAPTIAFRLLLARSEQPHRVIFQLAEPCDEAATAAGTTAAPGTPAGQGATSGSAFGMVRGFHGVAGRADLFGQPFVLSLPARSGEPRPIDQAQQILFLMQQLAELRFSLKYPTDTLSEKMRSFVARNVTARLQTRYIQPHVELQGELNRQFVELLGLILKENDDRSR